MTQEELNNEVQIRLAVHDAKFNAFLREMQDFKNEMRDRDNQRHAEMAELRQVIEASRQENETKNAEIRQSIKEIYQATDNKIAEIRNTVDSTNKHISNFFYTSLVAIGAMLLTVILNLPKG